MKLMTKKLENIFEKYPLYSQDGEGSNAKVIAHYFMPFKNCHWFITEANRLENGDYEMFGYCHISDGELGYVLFSDLKDTPYMERDMYYEPLTKTIKDFREEYGI